MSKQVNPLTQSVGFKTKLVQISQMTLDPSTGQTTAVCIDKTGYEVRCSAYTLRAKGAAPEVGETWIVDQELGFWSLAAYVGGADALQNLPGPGGGGGGGVTEVIAGDASVVVGGTGSEPSVQTGTLDQIASLHPPAASWSNNSKKITSLAPGTAPTDAATVGQLPSLSEVLGGVTVSGSATAGTRLTATSPTAALWVSEGPLDLTTIYGLDTSGGVAADSGIQSGMNAAGALGLGGGGAYLRPGKYKISNPLVPVGGVRLYGDNRVGTKLISTTCSIFNMGPATTQISFELDHLFLSATNFDVFSGANIERSYIHDCELQQLSAGNSIWNSSPGPGLMVEVVFERNIETVAGATRSVEAWLLVAPSNSNQVNACVWRDEICFNNGGDATQYWYHIQSTGSGTPISDGNTFDNCVFENALGGLIWLESVRGCLIRECLGYDAAASYGNSLILITKNASGGSSVSNTIINSGRITGSLGSGAYDIQLDSNCNATTIISPRGASSAPSLNLGNSSHYTVLGLSGGYTVTNHAGTVGDIFGNPVT